MIKIVLLLLNSQSLLEEHTQNSAAFLSASGNCLALKKSGVGKEEGEIKKSFSFLPTAHPFKELSLVLSSSYIVGKWRKADTGGKRGRQPG